MFFPFILGKCPEGTQCMKWTSVDDPPKTDGFYLTVGSGYSPYPCKVHCYRNGEWHTSYDITDWMPLPDAPKGK